MPVAAVTSVAFALASAAALAWLRLVRRPCVLLGYEVAAPLRGCGGLRNKVFLVRHGQSEANVAGVISSDPRVGTVKHTLTARGEEPARRAGPRIATLLSEEDRLDVAAGAAAGFLKVVCSDFLRTRRTAELVAGELGLKGEAVERRTELRERFFGTLDGQSDENYHRCWAFDSHSCLHSEFGCEPVASVVTRAGRLLLELDRQFSGCVIVLVAHGDVLQILRTGFEGKNPPALHRLGEPLQTGAVLRLRVTGYNEY